VDEGERHGLGAIFGDAVVVELLRVGRGPLLPEDFITKTTVP
jgi:hypothetical protein